MARTGKRKCLHCRGFYIPDHRNIRRQKYCSKPECRKASKAASQLKWLQQPDNQDYFRNPVHVKRVQQWRKDHPGYRRKKKSALQEPCPENIKQNPIDKPRLTSDALQDFCFAQPSVLLGLIANLTGSALQDDILKTLSVMQQLGNDILNDSAFKTQGGPDVIKTRHLPGTYPKNSKTIQPGGSPPRP